MIIEQEKDQSNKQLDYVFGVIQKPASRGQKFIIGWDGDGNPSVGVTANERGAITQKGYETRGRNAVLEFPLGSDVSTLTPKAFEFLEMSKPIDNRDSGNQFTEDVVNIACANGIGATSFLPVKELTLLNAIMGGQITWNIGNTPSYSLMIPDQDAGTLNFVLFSPGNNPSNELMYRTFLLRVIKTLATIDRNQVPPDQKGYMDVIRAVIQKLEEKTAGDRAHANPLEKIKVDLGMLEEAKGAALLSTLPVDDLRIVIKNFKTVVEESFTNGRQQ